MVKTKIVCTIGPASHSYTVLRKMIYAGMDVARLNFSHGGHAEQAERISLIRRLNRKYRRRVRILQDLEGHRIRIGTLEGGKPVTLKVKQLLRLTNKNITGNSGVIPFDYAGSLKIIIPGSLIFIDDGNICLAVRFSSREYLQAQVVTAGVLKENKGVNIPGVHLKFTGLNPKDREDIRFGIEHKVDYIAQSFVRSAKDVLDVRRLVEKSRAQCKIIAKIENRQGINNIDSIIDVSDGIMVARGDMGVSVPIYEIPMIQKQIIRKCNLKNKPVITATQMLESMTENPRPTRAEVTDVANAVLDGSDYVMLSAETAAGRYPVQSVEMMNKIISFTEKHQKI